MNWGEFKKHVDAELFRLGGGDETTINYIDVSSPSDDRVPYISVDDESMAVS